MRKLDVVILAAGKGERMRSSKPKVMHEIAARPLISYVVGRANDLSPDKIIVITGYGREAVEEHLRDKKVLYSMQKEQKGTAHALLTAEKLIAGNNVLVLYGDVPLIRKTTLESFLASARKRKEITFLTTEVEDPRGYGRVIIKKGRVEAIIEEAEATGEEKEIKTINTGICLIPAKHLSLLKEIRQNNKKGEYYLTDICKVARNKGLAVRAWHHKHSSEVLGINTRKELLEANMIMRERIQERHLENGVTLLDRNIYIDEGVSIGKDTIIGPNTYITGDTTIGENVSIGPNTLVKNCAIANNVTIEGFVVMDGAIVSEGVTVGPFSRIRPATELKENVKIGNFVEVKNCTILEGTKANHLSYIGDSEIGKDVNIGAGTITCNYDGRKKHKTIIDDNVFVGSNTALVAPVHIGENVVIGAGSTITKNVPDGSLSVARGQQKNIPGYGRKKRCAE